MVDDIILLFCGASDFLTCGDKFNQINSFRIMKNMIKISNRYTD